MSKATSGCIGAFLGFIFGAISGGFAGFILPYLYYELTNSRTLKDGE